MRALATIAIGAVIFGLFGNVACRRSSSSHPLVALATTTESQARFSVIQASWATSTVERRAGSRADLEALLTTATAHDDGIEPLVRAYLAIAWLDEGVPDAAEAVSRPLLEGAPGVPQDLAILVHGIASRRAGHAAEATEVLKTIDGKLLDGFARPMLDRELVEAMIDQSRYEEALTYADAWLREPAVDVHARRADVAKVLRRIPSTVAQGLVATAKGEGAHAGYSADLLYILTRDVEQEELPQMPDDDGGAPMMIGTILRGPSAVVMLVPSSSPRWGVSAAAAVRAAIEVATPRLGTETIADDAGVADAAIDAPTDAPTDALAADEAGARFVAPPPHARVRLTVFDTGVGAASEGAITRLLERAIQDGAVIAIGGVDADEASALAAAADRLRFPTLLLRAPSAPPKATPHHYLVLGSSDADEDAAINAAAAARPGEVIATVLEGSDAPVEGARDPLRVPCEPRPIDVDGARYPIADWAARRVSIVIVRGSAGCARDVAADLQRRGAPRGVRMVLAPSAMELVFEPLPIARFAVGAGAMPPRDDAPADLRALWNSQAAPVGWWAGLGRDALTLAVTTTTPSTGASTDETFAADLLGHLRSARVGFWTTDANGFNGDVLPRTFKTVAVAAGKALTPTWLARSTGATYK